MTIYDTAKALHQAGFNVIPVLIKTKAPWQGWQNFAHARMTDQDFADQWTGKTDPSVGIGLVQFECEGLDFDNHLGNAKEVFEQFLSAPEVMSIIKKHKLYYEKSKSGGYHLFYRTTTQVGNKKLAEVWAGEGTVKKKITIIETRGKGGQMVIAPTPGYTPLYGDLLSLPYISEEEREVLISYCKSFNQIPQQFAEVNPPKFQNITDQRPGDAFSNDPHNAQKIRDLLEKHGWQRVRVSGENEYWRRPGKSEGISATFNGVTFYNFSSSAYPFDSDKAYSMFQVYTILSQNGDYSAAAKTLKAETTVHKAMAAGVAVMSYSEEIKPVNEVKLEELTGSSFDKLKVLQEAKADIFENFFIYIQVNKKNEVSFPVDYNKLVKFLAAHNFRRFMLEDGFVLVRIQNNIIEQVQMHDITTFCQHYVAKHFKELPEMMHHMIAREDKIFNIGKLRFLPVVERSVIQDTATTAWFYFRNCAIKLEDQKNPEIYDYNDLPGLIWRKKIINRDFDPSALSEDHQGEFERFLRNVSGSEQRYSLLLSAIGYTLHRYKQSSKAKCFILCDEKIPHLEEDANGGTGKSIIAEFIRYYRNVSKIGSKNVNFKNQFVYQEVSVDTDLILFDDVDRNFPFGNLFDVITGDLRVEKKNQQPFTIAFSDSPKIMITTNHSVKGTGLSYDRRKLEIELTPYYREDFSPRDEFGHDLLREWDQVEQNRADALAIRATQFYLETGLLSNEKTQSTVRIRQAISETSRDFFEFMIEQIQKGSIASGAEFNRKALYQSFIAEYEDYKELKFQSFTKWVNKFAAIMRLKIRHRKSMADRYTLLLGDMDTVVKLYERNMEGN